MKPLIARAALCIALPLAICCAVVARVWDENKRLLTYIRSDIAVEVAAFREMWG